MSELAGSAQCAREPCEAAAAGAAGTAGLYRELRDFEVRHALFDREIGGIHYWEMSRYPVFCALAIERGLWGRGDGEAVAPTPERSSLGQRMAFGVEQLRRVPRGRLPAHSAPLLFVGHPRRKLRRDGRWCDLYLDPVAEHCRSLGIDSVYVEAPHRGRFHYAPAYTPGLVYLDPHIAWARIRPGRRLCLSERDASELAALDAALRSELGGRVSIAETARGVLQRFYDDRSMWGRILGRVRPRAVFLVAGAGQEGLVAEARERGVTSVELQHGTPVAGKMNYDFDIRDKPRRFFADYFGVYGAYWKQRNQWPVAPERIFELGCPFFQAASRELKGTPKRREIVFLSQATVGSGLARFAAELAGLLDPSWRLVYKLHPEELGAWRQRYPELADTRIEVVADREAELHPLLARAEFQVGVYSTALYEGIGLGCKTALVALPGVEYMGDLVERGMATVLREAAEFPALCEGLEGDAAWAPALFGSDWEPKLEGFLTDALGLELGRVPA